MKLSHSSMSTYAACPKRWEFKYVQRLKEKARHYFSFGKSIHSALEFFHDGEAAPTLAQLLEAFKLNWVSEAYRDQKAEDKAFKDGAGMLTDYHRKHAALWTKPLSTEAKFDMDVAHVRVTGFIDRVDVGEDGGLHVLDYKTGKPIDPERIAEDEQLTMYQLAAEYLYPGELVDKLSLYHVPTLTWHSAPRRSAELVERLKAKVVATAAAISRQEFEPKPSEEACALCDFKPLCPAWAPQP